MLYRNDIKNKRIKFNSLNKTKTTNPKYKRNNSKQFVQYLKVIERLQQKEQYGWFIS